MFTTSVTSKSDNIFKCSHKKTNKDYSKIPGNVAKLVYRIVQSFLNSQQVILGHSALLVIRKRFRGGVKEAVTGLVGRAEIFV